MKCNSDITNGVAPTHQTNDELLWIDFSWDFQQAFTDTTLEQRAYGELVNCAMGSRSIDELCYGKQIN